MPYNPGSAYPRKSTYVPPVYGEHSFQRAINAPDFTPSTPSAGMGANLKGTIFARAGAATNVGHASVRSNMESMMRPGVMGNLENRRREQAGMRQNQSRPQAPARTAPSGPASGPLSQQQIGAANQGISGRYNLPGTGGGPNQPPSAPGGVPQGRGPGPKPHPGGMHSGTPQQVEQMHAAGDAMDAAGQAIIGSKDVGVIHATAASMTAGPGIYVPGEAGADQARQAQNAFLFTMNSQRK